MKGAPVERKYRVTFLVMFAVSIVVLLLIAAYNFGNQDGIRQQKLNSAKIWLGEQQMVYTEVKTEDYGWYNITVMAPSYLDSRSLSELIYRFNEDRGVTLPNKLTDDFLQGSYIWIPQVALK